MSAAKKKPLVSFHPPRKVAKPVTASYVAATPIKREPRVMTRSRRGHVKLASGAERGRLNILVTPELRKSLIKLAVERDLKVSELASELLSEAMLARK